MRRIAAPLVVIFIMLAPILVSPSLRAGMGDTFEGTKEFFLNEVLNRDSLREFAAGLVGLVVLIAFMGTVAWLNTETSSESQLEGWRRVVFISTSLVFFLATFGVWLWGLTEITRVDWINSSPEEISAVSVFLMPLSVVGLIWIALAKPAFKAARLLVGR